MYLDCPEEPGIDAVLRYGEAPRHAEDEIAALFVSNEEFVKLCGKRKKSVRAKARTDFCLKYCPRRSKMTA
jgi:hypothetical protein